MGHIQTVAPYIRSTQLALHNLLHFYPRAFFTHPHSSQRYSSALPMNAPTRTSLCVFPSSRLALQISSLSYCLSPALLPREILWDSSSRKNNAFLGALLCYCPFPLCLGFSVYLSCLLLDAWWEDTHASHYRALHMAGSKIHIRLPNSLAQQAK
jgi:hypothetical protein